MVNEELQTMQGTSLVKEELTVGDVLAQVNLIQNLMKSTMKQDEHYGVIPGTKKPSLYKAGAEKLGLMFRLTPEIEVSERQDGQHRESRVTCRLRHIPSGKIVGEGVGSCSTMEGKYRYRTGGGELTEVQVPKSYWDTRKEDPTKAMATLKKVANDAGIDGDKFGTKKDEAGVWRITTFGEKVEHDNPADYYNTILKMAKKRAHVDAMITATAASDIFTQDVEDLPGMPAPTPAKEVRHEETSLGANDQELKQSFEKQIALASKADGKAKDSLLSIYTEMNGALDTGLLTQASHKYLYNLLSARKDELKPSK